MQFIEKETTSVKSKITKKTHYFQAAMFICQIQIRFPVQSIVFKKFKKKTNRMHYLILVTFFDQIS